MTRSRRSIAIASLTAALLAGPLLASIALAADPIVVQPGDTLTSISRRHGVAIETLVRLNGIENPNRILAGQRLRLEPAPAASSGGAAPAPAATKRTHVVRAGEHLTGIARHYGTTIDAIARANGITDPSRIYAGQRLTIPVAGAPAAGSSSRMPASMAALVRERESVRRVIVEEARRYGVPPAFAMAVAWQESGWRQDVVSSAGAIGVMQLLPSTADWVGESMLGTPIDARDLRQNVRGGVRLLAHYLDRYDGNRALVLAAYYQGQTAVDRHGIYAVSRPYIASITALEALFGG
ncbi:MAG TPA: LysM peptidoglycan-binding domain-containing protein [Candidatus Limnocylindria bacterium]|nr:LysM peptidoglycan-binding domain-containing protein [Candidatus Limnocylindria bacterium]